MARTDFDLKGLKELHDKLEELPRGLQRGVLKRAGTEALEPMADHARAIVPVREGALRASIRIESKTIRSASFRASYAAFKRGGGARPKMRRGEKGTIQVQVVSGGRAAPHAVFVEMGTAKMPAEPFMRPAADSQANATIRRLADAIGKHLTKTATRLARRRAKLGI